MNRYFHPYLRILIPLFFVLHMFQAIAQEHAFVVTTPGANLRSGPALKHAVTNVVKRGERLELERYEGNYALVRRDNGHKGWIYWPAQGWKLTAPGQESRKSSSTSVARPETATAGRALISTLTDIGFPRGHLFEGARTAHARAFYFPVPMDGIRNGVLKIRYRVSGLLNPLSSLRVDLNDRPARQVSLTGKSVAGDGADWIEIPVTENDFDRDLLKVVVRAVLVASDNRCFDERALVLHFVQILPESNLELNVPLAQQSLRSAWVSLPNPVRVLASSAMQPDGFITALETGVHLRRMNRKVEWVDSVAEADVIIDNEAALATRFPGFKAGTGGDDVGGGVALVAQADRRSLILISDRVSPDLFLGLQPKWVSLLKGARYVRSPGANPSLFNEEDGALDLAALGLIGSQNIHHAAEWTVHLGPPSIPAYMRPVAVRLNYIGTPDLVDDRVMIYAYLNDRLQEVRAVEVTGKPQSINFSLGTDAQRSGGNTLRIVAQRTRQERDCAGDAIGLPFEMLPGSAVVMKTIDEIPLQFNDLKAFFGRGVDLVITRPALSDVRRILPLILGVFANHEFPLDRRRISFLEEKEEFKPARPFLLLGKPNHALAESGVRFDQGAVQIVDSKKRVLLAVDQLPGLSVAQIARHNGQHGLWLVPAVGGPLTPAARIFLDQDNVAFLDERGVVLTLNSNAPDVSRVEYIEATNWFDIVEQNRFWFIAFGWTALAVLMIQLYRKVRRQS